MSSRLQRDIHVETKRKKLVMWRERGGNKNGGRTSFQFREETIKSKHLSYEVTERSAFNAQRKGGRFDSLINSIADEKH